MPIPRLPMLDSVGDRRHWHEFSSANIWEDMMVPLAVSLGIRPSRARQAERKSLSDSHVYIGHGHFSHRWDSHSLSSGVMAMLLRSLSDMQNGLGSSPCSHRAFVASTANLLSVTAPMARSAMGMCLQPSTTPRPVALPPPPRALMCGPCFWPQAYPCLVQSPLQLRRLVWWRRSAACSGSSISRTFASPWWRTS